MNKHTPGPWGVARIRGFEVREEQNHRNARLIAAAPELLEALRALVAAGPNDDDDYGRAYEAAERAIAKAEGR